MFLRHFFDILLCAWITAIITESGQGVRAVGSRYVIHKIYKLEAFEDLVKYDAAAQACEDRSARLVRVKSQAINKALKPLISEGAHYFIGLRQTSDNSLNSWTWNDGTSISRTPQEGYQNWKEYEPSHLGERCVAACASNKHCEKGKWLDLLCNGYPRKYICQSNVIQMDPPKSTITVIQGSVITVNLVIKTYGGLLTVEAYKDSTAAKIVQRDVGNETLPYPINSADWSKSGKYTFRAFPSPSGNPMETVKLSVVLHVPVSIPTPPQSVSSPNANGINHVTCSANGDPTPGVYWQRKGVNVSTSQGTVTQTIGKKVAWLYIKNAMQDDAGKYTCVAFNYVGEEGIEKKKSAEITLTVYGKPTIFSHEVDNCSVRGRINITWRADEASTDLNHKYEVSGSGPPQEGNLLKPYDGDQHLEIKDLKTGTSYTFKIIACLDGPCTNEILNNEVTATTGPGLPRRITSAVKLQMSKNNSLDQCSVSWMETAAAIAEKFEVTISWSFVNKPLNIETRNGSTIHSVLSKNLKYDWDAKPNRKYVAEVAAANCAGSGEKSKAVGNCRTKPKAPDVVPSPSVSNKYTGSKREIHIVLPDETNGPVSCIFIVVKIGITAEHNFTLDTLKKVKDAANQESLANNAEYMSLAIQRSTVTGNKKTLTLGDGSTTKCDMRSSASSRKRRAANESISDDVYQAKNWPLQEGYDYSYYAVTATASEDGDVFLRASPHQSFPNGEPGSSTGTILGVLIAIFCLCALALILLYVHRNRRQKEGPSNGESLPIQQEAVYANLEADDNQPRSETDIPLNRLQSAFDNLVENNRRLLRDQFEKIKVEAQTSTLTAKVASRFALKKKNRYKNIHPYDMNRVRINGEGDGDDTFINASYIHGYSKAKKFIATQGPLQSSVEDFWKMVAEQNSRVIVMLTKCTEAGKNKCQQYWPEHGRSSQLGDLKVEAVSERSYGGFVKRVFKVTLNNQREITTEQIQYLNWPDHGVPVTTSGIFRLHKAVMESQGNADSPIIVHCSAGAGRTGAFIGFDRLIEEGRGLNRVDIFSCVVNMREQRMDMVQTIDQYQLLHKLLLEWHYFGDTDIDVSRLESKILQHMDRRAGQKTTIIDEFENLRLAETLNIGRGHGSNVVIVRHAHERETPSVSATFIESYGGIRMIASEGPTTPNVEHFWRAIVDNDVATIIMLNRAGSEQECIQYWPSTTADSESFGHISVHLAEERSVRGISERTFSIKKKHQTKTVVQYQYINWQAERCPENPSGVLNLVSKMKANVRANKDGAVLVHCSDGLGRTGTFCAIVSITEQLECEGTVDVFKNVKDLRDYRQGMVKSLDQYTFCYQAAQAQIDTSQLYANTGGENQEAIYQNV